MKVLTWFLQDPPIFAVARGASNRLVLKIGTRNWKRIIFDVDVDLWSIQKPLSCDVTFGEVTNSLM